MFAQLPAPSSTVSVFIEGTEVCVPAACSAAAAMLIAHAVYTRESPVDAAPRAPYCMMGVCFECLLVIDGQPSQQGCLVPVRPGMRIERQRGARSL